MRSLLCVVALVSAAACRTTTSPIGFQAFRVRSVTPDFGHRKIALHVALDFRVRNPLTIPLVIPQHGYTAKLGGGSDPITQPGALPQTTVAAGEVKVLSYDIDIDPSGPGLAALAGRDAPYSFSAEVDVVRQPLAVEGKVTLDLGYGPITLPVERSPSSRPARRST